MEEAEGINEEKYLLSALIVNIYTVRFFSSVST
jgi:hypothetical protein